MPLPALRPGVRVEVDHVSLRGEGRARVGEREVSVPGLFGGESGEVEIVHRSRQRALDAARLVRVVTPHPERRSAPCPRHEARGGRCGGCPLMELAEPAQRDQKVRMLEALGLRVDRMVHAGSELAYRVSSKRVVFGRRGSLALGSFVRASHEGADMRGCLVDHPRIVEAADELAREASAAGIAPYDEKSAHGDLRYAWLKTDGERVLTTLITAAEPSEAARVLPSRLSASDGIAWSVQPARDNAIRGSSPRILRGIDQLTVCVAGVSISVGPLGFLQPNLRAMERAYLELVEGLRGALAWDLYAGSGVVTTLLSRAFTRVEACESYDESAAALGVPARSVEQFLAAQRETPDAIVANPPRRGLGSDVCTALSHIGAPRLHLMSCGPEGMARDLALLRNGGYECESLTAYDSLPQTPHIELVALLRRGTS